MHRILLICFLSTLVLSACNKLGTEYPYDAVPSRYTDAYDISLIFDPLGAVQNIDKGLVFANAQNGTTYTFEQSFGKGYDLHLCTILDDDELKLYSIYKISTLFNNSNLWLANDPNTAHIQFSELDIVDSSKFLYESIQDEKSLNFVMSMDNIKKFTLNDEYTIDTTGLKDEPKYIHFASYTSGTDSDSKDVKGVLKLTGVNYSDQFIKIYFEGKVMYAY